MYLIVWPLGTEIVLFSVIPGCTSSIIVVQLEPPSTVYSTWNQTFELDVEDASKFNVDIWAPLTQLPKTPVDATPSAIGQSTRSDWTIDATVA